jgi:integrase
VADLEGLRGKSTGEAGIRTLGTLLGYNALAKRRFTYDNKLNLCHTCAECIDLTMKERKKQKFEPFKVVLNGRTFWQVNLESEYRTKEDGTRARVRPRRTFAQAEEARTFAQLKRVERTNHGSKGASMDEQVRGDALAALEILRPLGITLREAAIEIAKGRELGARSETVAKAITSLLDAKSADNLRPRYLKDLRNRLARFALAFGERKLADITPVEIDQWLRTLGLSPLGRNTFRSRISVLFEYGRQCGWTSTNPVAEVRKVKVSESLPEILTPEQAARLLEAAAHGTLPYWALGLFCGLRAAELQRLTWADIHFEEGVVEVPSLASKTASRRFVPIRANLAQWLEPYKAMRVPLCPTNLRVRLETDRKNAGLSQWPSNCLRHSFGSYHLQQFQNAGQTAMEMGHSQVEITFRHYNQRVLPSAAERFWKIAPLVQSQHILEVVA